MVRLNVDGSIDATFNFAVNLSDYFGSSSGGQNRFAFQNDGKIFSECRAAGVRERRPQLD
jgi:hypothetical protein